MAWLHSRGLWCEPRSPFHLFADRIVDGPFELVRVWHTPARLGDSTNRTRAVRHAVVQIDGSLSISSAGSTVSLEPGGVVLLPVSAPWTLDSAVASARVEIGLRRALWPAEGAEGGLEAVRAISEAYRQVLVAAAISALSSELQADDPGFQSFRLAVETLVAALPEMLGHATPTAPEEALWREAKDAIAREASDPDLTVAVLADRLLVSVRHLHRLFAERGSTPLAEIRSARAALASHHLALSRNSLTRAEIARRAGFRTVRAMNEALRASR
ncbi:hypothetical protein [Rathayibacter sp. Leaf296]|uniref:hypothetical protein n=1 Tax=Rathayibacter sp. Leaf296 TaxID=1736327 RepID=UPI000712F901|nr:hypothetical protein [Rathayibacter sp. Leaf296]KQQ10151.1 hypothetical protein ASF46_03405 [Rathayibacter sp. Leaf296]